MLKTRRTLEKSGGALSFAAGLLHGLVAPAHVEEWWGYGLFFVFAAAAQVLLGLALLTNAVTESGFGAAATRARRVLYAVGIVGNLAILVLYVVTRTSGIPWFGPEAGTVEEVAPLDVFAAILEVATCVCLAILLTRREPSTA